MGSKPFDVTVKRTSLTSLTNRSHDGTVPFG